MASTSPRLNKHTERNAKLLDTAVSGDLRAFEKAARKLARDKGEKLAEAIISACDKNGNGPLHYAACSGNNQICRYLIDKLNFDPNLSSHTGKTPIMHAAEHGRVSTIKYLISKHANLHQRAADGFNAMHHATLEANHKALRVLLSSGGPVDAEYITGAPLLLAAYYGDASSMKILLEYNANPNISFEFISPLVLSVAKDSKQCVEVLKAVVDLSKIPLLEWAIDSKEMMLYLLHNGAKPNLPNELGQLPLETAAAMGKKEIVNILFPLTSPGLELGSIEGLLCYFKSEHCKKESQKLSKRRIESLKNAIKNALNRREYFGASILSDFLPKEDAIANTIKSLCWGRCTNALNASSCSNDKDPFIFTDDEYEESLFSLLDDQLSVPIIDEIITSEMGKALTQKTPT